MGTVKRIYEVGDDLFEWLEGKAKREGRSVIRQVEKIIEAAREADLKTGELGDGSTIQN